MANEVHQLYESVKISGPLVSARELQQVWLWDCGPEKPKAPQRPNAPKGKDGDPEFDLAKIEFAEEAEKYQDALKAYGRAKVEFAHWEKIYGGPIEIQFWSCDARDAFQHDSKAVEDGRQTKLRYHLSCRTRGSEKLPNLGLPQGMMPGRGQEDNLRRLAESNADLIRAARRDPVFSMETRQ